MGRLRKITVELDADLLDDFLEKVHVSRKIRKQPAAINLAMREWIQNALEAVPKTNLASKNAPAYLSESFRKGTNITLPTKPDVDILAPIKIGIRDHASAIIALIDGLDEATGENLPTGGGDADESGAEETINQIAQASESVEEGAKHIRPRKKGRRGAA